METKEEKIIKLVASWLRPGIDMEKLKDSPFHDVVEERIREMMKEGAQ